MSDRAFDDLVTAMDGAMVVVTVAAGGERGGCLVGFHSQSSIGPPRFAVWLSITNRTTGLARDASHLAVHLLTADQHDLAQLFGGETGDEVDKLVHTAWERGPGDVPLLVACPNRFVGTVVERFDADGDHLCVVLEPNQSACSSPLVPLRLGDVSDIDAGHRP